MGVGGRLRALDDAVLGDRLRKPLPPDWRWTAFWLQLLAVLGFCAVWALFGDGIPHGVVWPWLLIVLMQGPQVRRLRARTSEGPTG